MPHLLLIILNQIFLLKSVIIVILFVLHDVRVRLQCGYINDTPLTPAKFQTKYPFPSSPPDLCVRFESIEFRFMHKNIL